jgi:hypothetical protein
MLARFPAALAACAVLAALAGCKPPPTDAAVARVSLLVPEGAPSEPQPSPDTTGALWVSSAGRAQNPLRLVYGVPGKPVLLSLECLAPATLGARLRITRHAKADEGAGALLALIGNGWIGRFPVDAVRIGQRSLWQGEAPAANPAWDALKPEREATVTVPGAGLVRLNPSPLPMALVEACRGAPAATSVPPPAAPESRV